MVKRAGLVLVGLLCLLALAPATSPVQLSYVYSDSMEPAIDKYDGYLLVPTDGVTEGDVVTFWSSERDSYVTHRVVGRSDRGLITKGDANPSTDQAAGAPYVRPGRIRGQVLTVRGTPVVIPGLGRLVRFLQTHRVAIAGLVGAALVLGLLRDRSSGRPGRSVTRARDVLWPVFAVAVLSAVAFQFLGGQTEQLTYVAVDADASSPNQLTVGESTTTTVVVERSTAPATRSVVSADGMAMVNQTRNASTITATFRLPPPERTGTVTATVGVDRYRTVLPQRLVRELHRIHPLLAGSVTVGTGILPAVALMFALVDGKRPMRSTESRTGRALRRRWREL